MKTSILFAGLCLLAASFCRAQGQNNATPEVRAQRYLDAPALAPLSLNAEQKAAAAVILVALNKSLDSLNAKPATISLPVSGNEDAMLTAYKNAYKLATDEQLAKRRAIMEGNERKFVALLSADQNTAYAAVVKARPANAGFGQQQGGGGRGPAIGTMTATPAAHDPVMAKEKDTYHVFYTGGGHYSSKDMQNWKIEKPVFDASTWPKWISEEAKLSATSYWAPDIAFYNGQWYLYYAVSAFGKNTSAIGVATNKTLDPASPDYKWVDHGKVIQSYPGTTNWNAIDPAFIVDEKGTPWLSFGSFWQGLPLIKLTKDGFRPAEGPDELRIIASRKTDPWAPNPPSDGVHPADAGGNAIEAPYIFKKGQYYYLFVSWDYCCSGVRSDYKIAVGRSKSVSGPYLDKNGVDMAKGGGTVLLEGDKGEQKTVYALGHNSTYTFDGTDYMIYHKYLQNGNVMGINKLTWDKDGWPVVSDYKSSVTTR